MIADSLFLLSALALFAACVGAWRMAGTFRSAARMPLRFSAMAFSALAVAAALRLGDVTALLLLPLAGASLALGVLARFARPAHTGVASAALMAGLGLGLAAMLSGHWLLALAPLAACALTIVAAALNGMAFVPALGGVALLAAGLSLLQNGVGAGTLLLCAAGVIGAVRSTAAVDQKPKARIGAGIGGVQPRIGLAALGHRLAQDLRDK